MEKIINSILDFPHMVNQKLPKNCFNEMMDNSEGSVSDWTGKIFRVGALVVLVGMLFSVIILREDIFHGTIMLMPVLITLSLLGPRLGMDIFYTETERPERYVK